MKIKKGTWTPPATLWTAEQIMALRQRMEWSQVTLARKIGSTVQTISSWERGTARPGHRYTRALEALCKKYHPQEG